MQMKKRCQRQKVASFLKEGDVNPFFFFTKVKSQWTQDHEIAIPDGNLKANIYEIRMSFFIKQKKCVVQNISMCSYLYPQTSYKIATKHLKLHCLLLLHKVSRYLNKYVGLQNRLGNYISFTQQYLSRFDLKG